MGLDVDDLAMDIQREVDDNNATREDYERALDIVFPVPTRLELSKISGGALKAGDVLVSGGSRTVVTDDAQLSATMPGFVIVETEVGCLYLDPDEDVRIL